MAKLSDRWQAKLVQGIFDQFAPLKGISATAYMQARLSKGADGAAEYLVRHGAVKLEDGALDTAGGKGLAEILAGLNGEHDHFMAWIAANRAERLAAEWEVRFENGVTERFADEAAARAEAAKWPGARAQSASRERLFTPETSRPASAWPAARWPTAATAPRRTARRWPSSTPCSAPYWTWPSSPAWSIPARASSGKASFTSRSTA